MLVGRWPKPLLDGLCAGGFPGFPFADLHKLQRVLVEIRIERPAKMYFRDRSGDLKLGPGGKETEADRDRGRGDDAHQDDAKWGR